VGDFFNKGSESLIKSGLKIPRSYQAEKEDLKMILWAGIRGGSL